MTRDEILQVLSILKAAYPHSYQKMTKMDAEAVVSLWMRQFENEDAGAVGMAVDALIATRREGYSPTVGEVKEQLHRIRTAETQMSDAEAWALVEKACRNGLYGYREEFERLPGEVQRAIGGAEQLKAWAAMDEETVNSVVASNFRKSFRAVQLREKETAMLPAGVRAFAAELAEQMRMEGAERRGIGTGAKAAVLLSAGLKPMIQTGGEPDIGGQTSTDTVWSAAAPAMGSEKSDAVVSPAAPVPEYRSMSEEDWTRKREEAMRKLEAGSLKQERRRAEMK